tara:strand:+ start:433 stop:567 length:135 start_codon:yes stop_codon:yes gene_type:complete
MNMGLVLEMIADMFVDMVVDMVVDTEVYTKRVLGLEDGIHERRL